MFSFRRIRSLFFPEDFFVLFSFRGKKREPEKKAINPLGQYRCARPSAALAFPAKNILRGFSFRKAPQGKTESACRGRPARLFPLILLPVKVSFLWFFLFFSRKKRKNRKKSKRKKGGCKKPTGPRRWRGPVGYASACLRYASAYSMMLVTTPEPTVRPPSRMAKRSPCSMAMGVISLIVMRMLSPGMTISTPSGSSIVPVTSVVRK